MVLRVFLDIATRIKIGEKDLTDWSPADRDYFHLGRLIRLSIALIPQTTALKLIPDREYFA